MRLRRKLQRIRIGVWLSVLAAGILTFFALVGSGWAMLGLLAIPAVAYVPYLTRRLQTDVVRSAQRRLRAHAEAGDSDAARALIDEFREVYGKTPSGLESVRLQEAGLLTYEGRHAEALVLLESIDRRSLPPTYLPFLLNSLAWALAQTGQGLRAVTVARESMDAWARLGDRVAVTEDLRASQLGTLGAALVVAGQAEEAAPLLEQSLARGGTAWQQAARSYYLGEALRAIGRSDEARAAWTRAAEGAPTSELGKLARVRLGASPWR